MTSRISEKIIDKIKKEEIKPAPKWHFLLKNYVVWVFFLFSILIGSLSFSVILFFITNSGLDAYAFLNRNPLGGLILSLPRFWLAFLLIFLAVAYYNYKHTKGGYRYNSYLIIILSIIISFIFGSLLFLFGLGKKTDDLLNKNISIYRENTIRHKQRMWGHPEKGFLIGHITKFNGDKNFTLKDFNEKFWEVNGEEAVRMGKFPLTEEMEVRIIGASQEPNIFFARIIKSGPPGCMEQAHHCR